MPCWYQNTDKYTSVLLHWYTIPQNFFLFYMLSGIITSNPEWKELLKFCYDFWTITSQIMFSVFYLTRNMGIWLSVISFNRWCWHSKYDREDWTKRVHGIWEPLHVWWLVWRLPIVKPWVFIFWWGLMVFDEASWSAFLAFLYQLLGWYFASVFLFLSFSGVIAVLSILVLILYQHWL